MVTTLQSWYKSSWDCGFTMHRVRLAAGAVQLLTSSDSEDGQAVKAKPPGRGAWLGLLLSLHAEWAVGTVASGCPPHPCSPPLSGQAPLLGGRSFLLSATLDECPSPHFPHPSTTGIGMSSV